MKVVSQLKRTLSTVLAMMMVLTSVPQMAMPVLADELPPVESVSFNVVKDDSAENAVVTVSGNTVSENEVPGEYQYSVSANDIVYITVEAKEGFVLEAANVNNEDTSVVEGVAKAQISANAIPENGDVVVKATVVPEEEPECEHVFEIVSYGDGTHAYVCTKCGVVDGDVLDCIYDEHGVCTVCKYKNPDEALVVAYSSARYFIAKPNKVAKIAAPKTTVGGKKAKAIYTISSNKTAIKINESTGAITVPAGTLAADETVFAYVNASLQGDSAKVADTQVIEISTKDVAKDAAGIALAKVSENGILTVVSANIITKANGDIKSQTYDGLVANGDEYKAVVLTTEGAKKLQKDGAVLEEADLMPEYLYKFATSNKKVAAPIAGTAGNLKLVGVKKATITVKTSDGSTGFKAKKFTINTKWKELAVEDIMLAVGGEAEDLKSVSINAAKTKTKTRRGVTTDVARTYEATISANGLLTDAYNYAFSVSNNGVAGYSFKAAFKNATKIGADQLVFKTKKNKRTGNMEVLPVTVTIKGKDKDGVAATVIFTVTNDTKAAPAANKVAIPKKQPNSTSANALDTAAHKAAGQKLYLEIKNTLKDKATALDIVVDPVAAAKTKDAKRYAAFANAISGNDVKVNGNIAVLEVAPGAELTKGNYKVLVTAKDATGAISVPTALTIKVVAAKLTAQKYTVKTVASISKNSVSGNWCKTGTKKVTASVSVNNIGVSNAQYKKTGEVNNFMDCFDAYVAENPADGIVVVLKKDASAIEAKDCIGFVTYTYNTAVDAEGNKINWKTVTTKVTVKLTNR